MDLRKMFDCMISVSELGRGQASKVMQTVEETGHPYIVIKNNKPQAVIISISEYAELVKAKEVVASLDSQDQAALPTAGDSYNHLSEEEIQFFLYGEQNDK